MARANEALLAPADAPALVPDTALAIFRDAGFGEDLLNDRPEAARVQISCIEAVVD
jgi:hypothetical protein